MGTFVYRTEGCEVPARRSQEDSSVQRPWYVEEREFRTPEQSVAPLVSWLSPPVLASPVQSSACSHRAWRLWKHPLLLVLCPKSETLGLVIPSTHLPHFLFWVPC